MSVSYWQHFTLIRSNFSLSRHRHGADTTTYYFVQCRCSLIFKYNINILLYKCISYIFMYVCITGPAHEHLFIFQLIKIICVLSQHTNKAKLFVLLYGCLVTLVIIWFATLWCISNNYVIILNCLFTVLSFGYRNFLL